MWLFTETGFYSVVIDAQNQGRMLIRCRCAIDAANLWKNHHDALPSMTEPVSREDRDYRWRLSISRRDWIKLAGRLAETVQYDNFKSAVHRNPSQGSKSGSYLRIWSTMADLQRSETHGDVVKRHQPDDAAAWQSFVAKVDKPVTTKPVKRKAAKKSRKQAKKLWRS
jgi:hypothetical protein